jgi:NodT family efflux transporter outer membrane factor (OMF) lipoprotein
MLRGKRGGWGAQRWGWAVVPMLAAVVSGCVVGPDFKQPDAPTTGSLVPGKLKSPGTAGGERQAFHQGRDIPGDWWRLFRSKPLNALVDRALAGNFDLRAARAALRVAQANVEAGRGAFFPQISGNYQAQRQKVSLDPLLPSTPTGTPYYTTHTVQLSVGYVPDVFGGVRRQVEALNAQAEASRFQLEATQLTLTANLALAAIQEASLRGQIAATKKLISLAKDLLDLQKRQQALGQVGALDVATQEAALAQFEQTLPPLEKSLAVARDQMIALTGRLPGDGLPATFEFATFHLPEDLPASLPSDVVRQRPDVRAAEANVHAASAQVGVAVANRLPQFNLLANGGTMSSAFANVLNFSTPYSFWTIAGSVSQVIFDGFTLEQKQRAAEAGLDQAAAQYHAAVVTGFQNIADSLQALDYDARSLKAALAGRAAADKSLDLIRKQLQLGQVSALQVLNAQQTYLQAELAVVQAKAARYSDTVALFQALGGGWWNRSDVEEDARGWAGWHMDVVPAAVPVVDAGR